MTMTRKESNKCCRTNKGREGPLTATRGEGSVTVSPQQTVVGETGTWVITYTVGPKGIAVGGGLRVFFDTRESPYLVTSPSADQEVLFPCTVPYGRVCRVESSSPWRVKRHSEQPKAICPQLLTASTSGKSRLELSAGCFKVTECYQLAADYEPDVSTFGYLCKITVREYPLSEGDTIKVVFGDLERELPGFRAPIYANDKFKLWVMVDSEGNDAYHYIVSPCIVQVAPGPANGLDLKLPSTVVVGESFEMVLSARDRYGNISRSYEGTVGLEVPEGIEGLPQEYIFTSEDKGRHAFPGVSFREERVHFISAADRAMPLIAGRSNPVRCLAEEPPLRVYWGDIHGHSVLSDGGERTPEEYYSYGRDIARLDFCALTDHSWCVRDGGGARVRQAAIDFNEPGRFVTLFGYECTHMQGERGIPCAHRNVYHLEVDHPIYNTDKYFPRRGTRDFDTLQQLWEALEGTGALIIVHGCTNWDLHHEGLERLVEIYSKWGSREYYGCESPDPSLSAYPMWTVQDGLGRGKRVGFVGGSDSHCGRPGNKSPELLLSYPSGLTAVYAEELTRRGIWEGLWERHTYVTTGERILLYFSIDGHLMGEEYVTDRDPVVKVKVTGTNDIGIVELIKDGAVIHTHYGTGIQEGFELRVAGPGAETSYYYVRVRQGDTARAWSSPIWVSRDVGG